MMAEQKAAPPLAGLVRAGDNQTEAERITDFIFMAHDVSNAYLVTTSDGDVMVNTGFPNNADRNVALFAPHRTGVMRHIFLTQSHSDHFGGVPEFTEPGTTVFAGPGFKEALADMMGLQPFFGPRTRKLWGTTIANPKPAPDVVPDVLIDRELTVDCGNRQFVLISAPEGETVDNMLVWMPHEKVLFTGNTFGPVFLSMPFLNTLRGDKPRLVRNYLKALERVRDLDAEILITGHGAPIVGKDKIRADLDRMHAAVSYVRDYTLEGMKAGKDVHTLMREFAFSDNLKIGDFHGKASWAVKSIWREYAGWFHYEDGTTALYGVPQTSVHPDLVELAGGAGALAARAKAHADAGRPLEALHLTAIALTAEPNNHEALLIKKAASEALLAASGGSNLSETMWLRSEIAEVEGMLGG